MDGRVRKGRRSIWVCFIVCLIVGASSQGETKDDAKGFPQKGSVLPRILLRASSAEESRYLGIGKRKVFTFQDISAEILLIDYINTNCSNCMRAVPTLNEIYRRIEGDSLLKGKVKVLAIGAGDTQTEVNHFKEALKIPYPVFPDEEYKAHDAAGSPRVPFLIIARKDSRGKWTVVDTKVGVMGEAEYRSTTYLEEDWFVQKMEGGVSSVDDFLEELKQILSARGKATDPKEKPVR